MRICRESLLTKSPRSILSDRKGATAPFPCLPARTGAGRARYWVKGLVPCGFSGQRPEPSESFSISISAIFKVLLSLFFIAYFFIDYLTLPPAQQDTIFVPESYSQYYTKNLLSFVATIQLIYILIFQKYPPFPAFVLPSNIGFQTHTRKNRPAVLTYIDPMIYVSSSPILHIGIWVDQKYRYSQYNFSFFQTNPVLSFLSADYPPFSKRKTACPSSCSF